MSLTTEQQTTIHQLDASLAALLLYGNVREAPVVHEFYQLLSALVQSANSRDILLAHGRWFQALASNAWPSPQRRFLCSSQSNPWSGAVLDAVLTDANPFSQQVQSSKLSDLPAALQQAAQDDLTTLQALHDLPVAVPSQWVQQATEYPHPLPSFTDVAAEQPQTHEPAPASTPEHWSQLDGFVQHYQRQGTGLFGRYDALRWAGGQLQGIAHADGVLLDQLVGYEQPKQLLLQNTERLLNHHPALNVLLYGSRGAGKSSLVKALLNSYGDRGLRLIEVTKAHLIDLPNIVETLRSEPQKFILFVDDLSFEEDDEAFKALKVVLEGSVTERPQNIVVYATSNRRHLIREFHGDRPRLQDSGEIHQWDTVQEKLSFSDRFGLTLTFEPANQDTFLQIVRHLAHQENLTIDEAELTFQARRWATRHNGQSGRTARQFISWMQGQA